MLSNSPFEAAEVIQKRIGDFKPSVGIILGSGAGDIAKQIDRVAEIPYEEIPGFFKCNVAGHDGVMILGYFNGCPVACLKGRAHFYEGYDVTAIQTLIRTLKQIGCEKLFVTNAAASLRTEVQPGSLALINDHINFQFKNPLVGENDERFGPRFPDLTEAYSSHLRKITLESAKKLDIPLAQGVYLGVLGPCYETPAEIKAFQMWGADLVGMSTVADVIVARHCGLEVLAVSIVTNLGSGLSDVTLNHEDVLTMAEDAAQKLAALFSDVVTQI